MYDELTPSGIRTQLFHKLTQRGIRNKAKPRRISLATLKKKLVLVELTKSCMRARQQ
jgi:hypothetical protein